MEEAEGGSRSRATPAAWLATLALLAVGDAAHAYSGTPASIAGRTPKGTSPGCGSCHGSAPDSQTTVAISGTSVLAPGAQSTYTVTISRPGLANGTVAGMAVAASGSPTPLSVTPGMPTVLDAASGEVIHSTGAGPLRTASGGSVLYQFTFTMPPGVLPGETRTLYAVARLAGTTWQLAPDFVVSAPLEAPAGLTASASGKTSVSLAWTGGGPAYRVVYKQGAVPPLFMEDGASIDLGTQPSATIPGLAPGTTYSFAVYSRQHGSIAFSAASTATVATPATDPYPRISTIAGGGVGDGNLGPAAVLDDPRGLVREPNGDIVFADSAHGRVRRVSKATGRIATIAGTPYGVFAEGVPATSVSFGTVRDIVRDASGNLFVSASNRVLRIDAATGILTRIAGSATNVAGDTGDGGPATSALLREPSGLAIAANGDLYIADSGNHRIRRVAAATGTITTFAGDGYGGYLGDGAEAAFTSFQYPTSLAFDAAGNLVVADTDNNRVRKVAAGTTVVTTLEVLQIPIGLRIDSLGRIHVGEQGNRRIVRLLPGGGVETVAGTGSSGFNGDGHTGLGTTVSAAQGMDFEPDGSLLFSDTFNDRVRRVDQGTTVVSTLAGGLSKFDNGDGGTATGARFQEIVSTTTTADGFVYAIESNTNRTSSWIRWLDPDYDIILVQPGSAVSGLAGSKGPLVGIAGDAASAVLYGDTVSYVVRRYGPAGAQSVVLGAVGQQGYAGEGEPASASRLASPNGVAFDAAGNLYVADGPRVRKLDAVTGLFTTIAGNAGSDPLAEGIPATAASISPVALGADPDGNVFIAEYTTLRVRRIDAATGLIQTVAGNGSQSFAADGVPATSTAIGYLDSIAVDAAGNVYLSDSQHYRVRKVDAATGQIDTVAGKGVFGYEGDGGSARQARISGAVGLSVDADGNLLFGEYSRRIRRVTTAAAVSLAANAPVTANGAPVTFTATVTDGATPPSGFVVFRAGATKIPGCAAVAISSGAATCTTSSLAAGTHAIRAVYSGTPRTLSARSAPLSHKVDPPATPTSANVEVTQVAMPNPASAAKDVVVTLRATNYGPGFASQVVVTYPVPAGASFVWSSPGCTVASGTVTCSVGALAVGASASTTHRVVVRPATAGTMASHASIAAAQPDPFSSNNASALDVTVAATPAGVPVQRYRLYSPVTLEHHFTTDQNEYNVLGGFVGTWVQEGTVGKVLNNPGSYGGVQAVPYYRLYDTSTQWHHWTTDANEYYTLGLFPWWNQEGVDGWILPTQAPGTTELYRLLYPFVAGLHHWTIDANEYNTLIDSFGWIGEGGSGFVVQ